MVVHGDIILLPGFDGTEQRKHNFKTQNFECVWLQRLYTDESSPRFKFSDRRKVQAIKFGNNITVLLRACFHLRDYYGLPSFWSAIAGGFKTLPVDLAVETTTCFIVARRIYRLNEGQPFHFDSHATRAADALIAYLDSRPVQHLSTAPAAADLARSAAEFFSSVERSPLVDSARTTSTFPRHITAQFSSSAGSRKRSPSPDLPRQPQVAKRRSVTDTPHKSSPQNRAPPLLPPLKTGPNINAYPKHDPYHTPSTAQDGQALDGSFPQVTSNNEAGIKIRGQAKLPSLSSEELSSSYEELRQANRWLQTRVEVLETDKRQNEELLRAMDTKFVDLEKRMRAFETQPAMKETTSRLTAVETKLTEGDEAFRSLVTRVAALESRPDTKDECTSAEVRNKIMATDEQLAAEAAILRNFESQIPALIQQQQQMSNTADANASQVALVKQLDRQVASLREDMNPLQHGIDDRIRELDVKVGTLQENMVAVRKTVKDLDNKSFAPAVTNDSIKNVKGLPTSESVSDEVAQSTAKLERTFHEKIEECMEETLREVEDIIRDAQSASGQHQTTRIDAVAEELKELETTVQSMPHKIKVLEGRVNTITANLDTADKYEPQSTDPALLTGQVQEILKRVQELEQTRQAQPSDGNPDALQELDELSQKVKNILGGHEEQASFPVHIAVLSQRVGKVETTLQGLTTVLMG